MTPPVPLLALSPAFVTTPIKGRRVGVSFDCPACAGSEPRCRITAAFANPLEGSRPGIPEGERHHHREGETFEAMSLAPEVRSPCGRRWWVVRSQVQGYDVDAPWIRVACPGCGAAAGIHCRDGSPTHPYGYVPCAERTDA